MSERAITGADLDFGGRARWRDELERFAALQPDPDIAREAALLSLLRRGVDIAAVMPNGYHVCRWCGVTDDHEPDCQWVRHTRETTEWKAEARAALAAEYALLTLPQNVSNMVDRPTEPSAE